MLFSRVRFPWKWPMKSTVMMVAGTLPAASRATRGQSTEPFQPWIAVPTILVMAVKSRSVPTAVAGWMPKKSRSGVISDPPPVPVKPTSTPTSRPESA